MKKRKLLASFLCLTAALGTVGMATSCKKEKDPDKTEDPLKYTVTFDSNGGSAVKSVDVENGGTVTKPTDPTREGYTFAGWYTAKDGGSEFNFATTKITSATTIYAHWTEVKKAPVATLVYDNGSANGSITAVKDGDNYYFDEPETPKKDYNKFLGWFVGDTQFNFSTPVTDNVTLTAKWEQGYDTVNTVFNFDDGLNGSTSDVKITETTTIGRFTFGTAGVNANTRFEASRKDLNTGGKFRIRFTLMGSGTNNAVTIGGTGASSSGCTVSLDRITVVEGKEVATEVQKFGENLKNNEAVPTTNVSGLEAGVYEIVTTSSFRLNALSLTEKLPQGPTKEIELNLASVQKDFLLGRDFNSAGLVASLVYENGRKDLLSSDAIEIVVPEDFKTTAGVKTITVNYALSADVKYTQSYKVNVCAIESVVLYDYTLSSSRITLPLQTVFALNSTINHDNLVVKAKCLLPETTDKYIEFILDANEYTIADPETTTAGNKTISITYKADTTKTADYTIEIVAVPDLSAATEVKVTVNPSAPISTADTYNFKTINQALQFIQLANVPDEATKTITLTAGVVYHEKVEIDMPNVVLETDVTGLDMEGEDIEAIFNQFAVIEFDALNGKLDPSETSVHSTDGSATVSIRPNATNFVAQFVTFKNYYNTNALYNESLKITSDSQAVAALVQADKSTFVGCKFTSYHDTLYAQVGRQYYINCFIEGHTDYIFGYNATALFDDSYIKSIGAGATAEVNGNYNNGGYIVATKGFNKSIDTDAIDYGYVFDGCTFIADDATAAGSVSIARTWGSNMRITISNSELGGHISTEAFGVVTPEGKNMNDRYGKMNITDTLKPEYLIEYNNTGTGALTTSLTDTCTVVTENPDHRPVKIFAAKNGKVTYADSWAGMEPKDASVVLKNADGSVVGTLANIGYIGGHLTEGELKAAMPKTMIPAGKLLEGFYADAEFTTKYAYETVLTETNDVYVKFADAAVLPKKSYNFNNLTAGDITAETKLDDVVTIVGSTGKKFSVDANARTIQDADGADVAVTQRLKTGGSTDATGRYITIDLSAYGGKYTIEVFALTGSNATARTGQLRQGAVDGTSKFVVDCPAIQDGDQPIKSSGEVDGGYVYYLTADASINYYGINIKPVTNPDNPQPSKPAVTALSLDADDLTAGDITSATNWGTCEFVKLLGTDAANADGKLQNHFTVDTMSSAKKIADVTGAEVSVLNRVKCNGKGRTVEINLTNFSGSAVIEVFCQTSSGSDLTRGFQVLCEGAQVGSDYICSENAVMKFEITLECGKTYQLKNIINAINYYGINIKPAA